MSLSGYPEQRRTSAGPRILACAWLGFIAILLTGGVALSILGSPQAGRGVVVMDLPPAHAVAFRPAPILPRLPPAQAPGPAEQLEPMTAAPPPSVPPRITQQQFAGKALIADPALIENTPEGPLPRIADDGTTPMRAYAPAVVSDGRPRIAIVVSGLGISAKQTSAAIDGLPAGVTLALAPYDADVQRWVAMARRGGHEVLLELPMEPYDFPDSDLGPHTLRTGSAEDANTERMVWAMTRFTGYAGVTNLLGGRFLSDSNSLEPVMSFLARRGLFFFDNGQEAHSTAPDVAHSSGTAFLQADLTVDKIQTAMEIDRRLSSLETLARTRGNAVGAALLYPVTIERIRAWAQGLAGRGFVLVPASAIVGPVK